MVEIKEALAALDEAEKRYGPVGWFHAIRDALQSVAQEREDWEAPFTANSATLRADCPTSGCWFHAGHHGRCSTDESEPPVQPSALDVARAEVRRLDGELNSKIIHNSRLKLKVKCLEDSNAQLHRENDATLARAERLEAAIGKVIRDGMGQSQRTGETVVAAYEAHLRRLMREAAPVATGERPPCNQNYGPLPARCRRGEKHDGEHGPGDDVEQALARAWEATAQLRKLERAGEDVGNLGSMVLGSGAAPPVATGDRPWDEGGRDDYYSKLPGDAELVAGAPPTPATGKDK